MLFFQVLTTFALLLMLLTGAAATKCDNETTSWSELGDYNAISTAFGDACSHFDSICTADCKVCKLTPVQEMPIIHHVYFVDP